MFRIKRRVPLVNSGLSVNDPKLNYTFCFRGSDEKYRITYAKPNFGAYPIQAVSNDWVWIPEPEETVANTGKGNILDFGGDGDGKTDNYRAFKSAMHWLASHNGGTLVIPQGDFLVCATTGCAALPFVAEGDRRAITVPSNVNFEGIGGGMSNLNNNAGSNFPAPTRISIKALTGGTLENPRHHTLFRVGENTDRISFRNLELYASGTDQNNRTYGFELTGAWASSQGFMFDNVSFYGFYNGIYNHYSKVEDNSNPKKDMTQSWQGDYFKVTNSRATFNWNAAVYNDTQNADWKIDSFHIIMQKRIQDLAPEP